MSRDSRCHGVLVAIAAAASLATLSACGEPFDPDAAIAEIEARYGVSVQYQIGPDFLPAEWRKPPLNGHVEPIAPRPLELVLGDLPS